MKSLSVLFCIFVFCITFNVNIQAQNDTVKQHSGSYFSQPVDVVPKLIKYVAPKYPVSMLRNQIGTTVYLKILISDEGAVVKIVPAGPGNINTADTRVWAGKESIDTIGPGNINTADTVKMYPDTTITSDAYKEFVDAAIEAIKQWQFSPAIKNGKPVEVWMMVPVRFRLKEVK